MKKVFVILSLFLSNMLLGQKLTVNKNNKDSVVYYFEQLLNQDRSSLNLNKLELDTSLSKMEDYWVESILDSCVNSWNNFYAVSPHMFVFDLHGSGDNDFRKRCSKYLGSKFGLSENMGTLIQRDGEGKISDRELANLFFNNWKSSPHHYDNMKNKNGNKYYLTFSTVRYESVPRGTYGTLFVYCLIVKNEEQFIKGKYFEY